jgi:rhamnosyl/mannosyltransferase
VVSAKRFNRIYNRFVAAKHLAFVDRIIVSNPRILETSPLLRKYRSKVEVIPFGVDLRHYAANSASTPQARLGGRTLNLLFVGRLARYKGLDYLLRAMKSAPGHLKIVGSGPLESQVAQLRSTLGLEGTVDLLGFVPDDELLKLYADADVLVLPSIDRGEAFGYVLVEAMAMHTAVISTELGTGTSFVNQDGCTGLVIPPCDVGALVAAIRRLDENRLLLSSFKQQARKRVEEHFSLKMMLDRTESLYRGLGLPV